MRQPARRALVDTHYGISGLLSVAIWSELGDCRRFSRSEQAVRHSGLDVTVDASDLRRAHGHLSRQGPSTLRWALFEAARNASRPGSPDHDYYTQVKRRHNGRIAALSVARQFARRLLSHLAQPRPPTSSTRSRPEHRWARRSRSPIRTSRVCHRGLLRPRACPPHSGRTAT